MNTRGSAARQDHPEHFHLGENFARCSHSILLGIFVGRNADAVAANFSNLWTPVGVSPIKSDLSFVATVFRGSRRARDVDRHLRCASRLALFLRRVEQHHLHRRRSKRSAAQSAACRSRSAPASSLHSICSRMSLISACCRWKRFKHAPTIASAQRR